MKIAYMYVINNKITYLSIIPSDFSIIDNHSFHQDIIFPYTFIHCTCLYKKYMNVEYKQRLTYLHIPYYFSYPFFFYFSLTKTSLVTYNRRNNISLNNIKDTLLKNA